MSYGEIDSIISAWVKRHRLTLYTWYQNSEIRSVDLVDARGRKFQIWIDRPVSGKVVVHAWNYRKTGRDWNTTIDVLGERLEKVFVVVSDWMTN